MVSRDFGYYAPISAMLHSLLLINFSLAVFNMLPIPPLDGSNIVLAFLDYETSRKYMMLQQYSFIFLLLLMATGALKVLSIPVLYLAGGAMLMAKVVFGFALAS